MRIISKGNIRAAKRELKTRKKRLSYVTGEINRKTTEKEAIEVAIQYYDNNDLLTKEQTLYQGLTEQFRPETDARKKYNKLKQNASTLQTEIDSLKSEETTLNNEIDALENVIGISEQKIELRSLKNLAVHGIALVLILAIIASILCLTIPQLLALFGIKMSKKEIDESAEETIYVQLEDGTTREYSPEIDPKKIVAFGVIDADEDFVECDYIDESLIDGRITALFDEMYAKNLTVEEEEMLDDFIYMLNLPSVSQSAELTATLYEEGKLSPDISGETKEWTMYDNAGSIFTAIKIHNSTWYRDNGNSDGFIKFSQYIIDREQKVSAEKIESKIDEIIEAVKKGDKTTVSSLIKGLDALIRDESNNDAIGYYVGRYAAEIVGAVIAKDMALPENDLLYETANNGYATPRSISLKDLLDKMSSDAETFQEECGIMYTGKRETRRSLKPRSYYI